MTWITLATSHIFLLTWGLSLLRLSACTLLAAELGMLVCAKLKRDKPKFVEFSKGPASFELFLQQWAERQGVK